MASKEGNGPVKMMDRTVSTRRNHTTLKIESIVPFRGNKTKQNRCSTCRIHLIPSINLRKTSFGYCQTIVRTSYLFRFYIYTYNRDESYLGRPTFLLKWILPGGGPMGRILLSGI